MLDRVALLATLAANLEPQLPTWRLGDKPRNKQPTKDPISPEISPPDVAWINPPTANPLFAS